MSSAKNVTMMNETPPAVKFTPASGNGDFSAKHQARRELGKRKASFGPNWIRLGIVGMIFGGQFILGCGLSVGLLTGSVACPAEDRILSLLLVSTVLVAFPGVFLWVSCIKPSRQRIHLHAGGFEWIQGRACHRIEFGQIKEIREQIVEKQICSIPVLTDYHYVIELNESRELPQIRVGPFTRDVKTLGQELIQAVFPRILGETTERLLDSQTVSFGKVSMTLDGLHFAGKQLAWEHVDCQVQSGTVTVHDKRKRWGWWCYLPAKNIPNLWVFLLLCQRMTENQRKMG